MLPHLGPASQSDSRLFLSVDTPESIGLVYELWNGYSGAPGLLGAAQGGDTNYVYDAERRVHTNIKTGRDISPDQLVRYVRNVSNESNKRLRKNTQQLIAGIIILSVWYSRMRDLMRALYKTIWILSIGGFVFDDDFMRNAFYLFVLLQFNYLDNFAEQIYMGEQPLNGFAMLRAGMYADYGNGLWQNIWLDRAEADGKTEARRILGPNENHCSEKENPGSGRPGCKELAAKGWVPIREMVPITGAICYSKCLCTIETR